MTNSDYWHLALTMALKAGWSDEDITRHLHELVQAVDLLEEGFYENSFESFFFDGNSDLNGVSPIEALRLEESERLFALIRAQAVSV